MRRVARKILPDMAGNSGKVLTVLPTETEAAWETPGASEVYEALKDLLLEGANIELTFDDGTPSVTIESTASGGGSGSVFSRIWGLGT
jgi:hypothetical protein